MTPASGVPTRAHGDRVQPSRFAEQDCSCGDALPWHLHRAQPREKLPPAQEPAAVSPCEATAALRGGSEPGRGSHFPDIRVT